jgi:O-phospho-L-seryl-tRNASec:L-selenocysteinyl-tRNA synthase
MDDCNILNCIYYYYYIFFVGLEPIIMEPKLTIDESLETDVESIEKIILNMGAENIVCILTTTSCFAPRKCDSLEVVGALCKIHDIYHVVNNAYGLQSGKCTYTIQQAAHHGRVDIFVQSTDKNLMVPVGGAIIAGFNKELVQKVRQNYPGRASSSQMLDVFITMLSMGSNAYSSLLKKRRENFLYLKSQLEILASKFDEHVIDPQNQISIGKKNFLSTVVSYVINILLQLFRFVALQE